MASFSAGAFGQDTAFASTAWDFGGAPPVVEERDRGASRAPYDQRGLYPQRVTEFREEVAPVSEQILEAPAAPVDTTAADLSQVLEALRATAQSNDVEAERLARAERAATAMAVHAREELARLARNEEEYVAFVMAMLL